MGVVATFGDAQRDDPSRRRGKLLDDGLGVVRSQQVLDDRPDDPGLEGAVRVLDHQRVEAVLRGEGISHRAVALQHADTADSPPGALAFGEQAVDVHRLVRPRKPPTP